jgi:AraC-like DNA-binding protein
VNTKFEQLSLEHNHLINVSEAIAPLAFPAHWHSEVEVIAPLQNAYTLEVNGTRCELREGDIALLLPGDIHAIAAREERPSMVLQFPLALLTTLYDFRHYWSVFAHRRVVRSDECVAARLMSALMDIQLIARDTRAFREARIYTKLLEFFCILGEDILSRLHTVNQIAPLDASAQKIAAACAYIEEHCNEPLTLEYVASKMGYSKFYFSRLFKGNTNMPFQRFVTEARLRKAESLLAENGAKMIDIAMQSGFNSVSTFNRIFKQYKGCAPSEFRRLYDDGRL